MQQEEAFERVKREVGKLCKPYGVKSMVLTYDSYSGRKAELLPGDKEISRHFAPGLKWLYDPDASWETILSRPDWGTHYLFVVLLQGDDKDMLTSLAAQILAAEGLVGLVYCLFDPERTN